MGDTSEEKCGRSESMRGEVGEGVGGGGGAERHWGCRVAAGVAWGGVHGSVHKIQLK